MIIDDELHGLREMQRVLQEIGGLEIIGAYQDGLKAFLSITEQKPDIIFLDIEMPEISGIQLFNQIIETYGFISIVFVTAYDQYAIKAFELHAMDYILKPIEEERIRQAIKRAELYNKMVDQETESCSIRIECFKRFSLYKDNKLVNLNWRSKKCEELLAFVACHKGDYVSKAKIVDALWPDADREKGYNNLYATVYYLKKKMKEVGIGLAIESKKDKMRLDVTCIEIDIIKFEAFYKDNKSKEAKEIYKAMLLEEHDYLWCMTLQQKYDMMYMQI
ncbi:MAG: hypothetical protein K0S30_1268 [Clostridia bacterium]|jgi:two-component SAPR family response regulator|nr:hypothetical protein [Clostridia bacterium]